MLSLLQMGEELSAAARSDPGSRLGAPPPRVEQNAGTIPPLDRVKHPSFAFRGWTRSRLSKYYVGSWREQLEAQMNCAEWGVGL